MSKDSIENRMVTAENIPALAASYRLFWVGYENLYAKWRIKMRVVGRRGQLCNVGVRGTDAPGDLWMDTKETARHWLIEHGLSATRLAKLEADDWAAAIHCVSPDHKSMLCGISLSALKYASSNPGYRDADQFAGAISPDKQGSHGPGSCSPPGKADVCHPCRLIFRYQRSSRT